MAQQFTNTVSLTSDLSTIAFGFRPHFIRIDATTLNTAFLSFATTIPATTAATVGYPFTSGAPPLTFSNPIANGLTSIFTAISSSGGTTVIRVFAVRI